MSHRYQTQRSEEKNRIKSANMLLIMLGILVVLTVPAVKLVIGLEHYNRVWQNPLTVTAEVTMHDDYDDEGDTDFRSYISYCVDGLQYTNIGFEDKDTRSQLTAVGEQVLVEVSPENPAKLISDLASNGRTLLFLLPCLVWLVSAVWGLLIIRKRSRDVCETSDWETIAQDPMLTIRCRMSRPFWLLMSIGLFLLCWRYPSIYQKETLIAAAVCGAVRVYCLFRDIHDIRIIKEKNLNCAGTDL